MTDCLLKPTSQDLTLQLHKVREKISLLKHQYALSCQFYKLKDYFLKNGRRTAQRKGVRFNPRSWRKNRKLMENRVVLNKKEHWDKYFSLHDQERLLTRCLACSDNPSNYEYTYAFAEYTKIERIKSLEYFACINQYFDVDDLKYSALDKDTTNAEFDGCLRVLEDIVKLCEAMTSLRNNPSVETATVIQKCTYVLLMWAKGESSRNGCSTRLMFMLHSAMYACPSWKVIDALKRWCKGMRIVSIGSGTGVVEFCMKALGWSVDAVDPHDYKGKSLLVTHPICCEDYEFSTSYSGLAVLCLFYPGKEAFDQVMTDGKCNYLQALCNFLRNGHKRVIVIHGNHANEFMKAEDKDDMDLEDLCCGTKPLFKFLAGPWWTFKENSKYSRVVFCVSSFLPQESPKFMSIFDFDERKRLDALEYLQKEGYIVEGESLIAAAISKIECLQHQLEQQIKQERTRLRPLHIKVQAALLFIQMLKEYTKTLQCPDCDTIRVSIEKDFERYIEMESDRLVKYEQELYSMNKKIDQVLVHKNNKVLRQMSRVLKKYLNVNPDVSPPDVSPPDVSPPDVSPLNSRKKWFFIRLKRWYKNMNDPEYIQKGWVELVQEEIDETMQKLQKLAEEFVVLNLTI